MKIQISKDFTVKPKLPYKSVITPSSLFKGNCARCTWMTYWHNLSIPKNMNLQQTMSRIQESCFDGIDNYAISDLLPKGWSSLYKGKYSSQSIEINGEKTRWKFYGALDILSKNNDGTYSIIDGKVSMKKDDLELVASYWTQLEAYAYMLEKPEVGEPKKISTIGLLQWRINGAFQVDATSTSKGFRVEQRYIPVERNVEKFLAFMENFIGIIEGSFPSSNPECQECEFLKDIRFYTE